MIALSALLPCATVILSMLLLRQTGAKAASGGAIVAILLWASGTFISPAYPQLENAFIDAIILQIIVAAIILPGVIFIEFCRQIGTTAAVAGIIDNLDLNAKLAAIVIATGFGVLIESLTGFGVSLFVTVPLLAIRFKKHQTIGLALIGMCLMPWGALGVAAHLGSELAEIPIRPFSLTIWNISGPVALFLPILCLLFLPNRSFADFKLAICAGLLLSGGIGLGTYLVGIEIAGALGGALVICFIAASAAHKRKPFIVFAERKLAPYYLLIFAVLIQKILVVLLNHLDSTPTISSGRVTFTVLTSPGLSLVFAIFSAAFFLRAEEKKIPVKPKLRYLATGLATLNDYLSIYVQSSIGGGN